MNRLTWLIPCRAALGMVVGRPEGLSAMGAGRKGVWTSFLALPLGLLIGLALEAYDLQGRLVMPPFKDWGAWHALALHGMLLAISWLGYIALSYELAGIAKRHALWPRFVMVLNWVILIQYAFSAVAYIPQLVPLPTVAAQGLAVFVFGWALWIEWFATRETLQIPGLAAAAMVALDSLFSLLLINIEAN